MVEELAVTGVVEIFNRLISLAFEEIGLMCVVKGEVEKLGRVLTKIQAMLYDAEKKQMESRSLKLWLKDLKEMALDAEDILDEIAYEDLSYKADNSMVKKVRNFFSYSNPLALRSKIAHKIKDFNNKLVEIEKEKDKFQLEPQNVRPEIVNRETSSYVDDSGVVGRETDKSNIVNMLIPDDASSSRQVGNSLSVIAIVGLGGLGKSMLAKLVCNDPNVRDHFDLRIWVSASGDFTIRRLWTQILENIMITGKYESSSTLGLLNSLIKELNGKKFLLVVDDVWNEDRDQWDKFVLPLKSGAIGSKIIVTTRSEMVASVVGTLPAYHLGILSDEVCWTLFEGQAFKSGGPEMTPTIKRIGIEIVKKCGGVPLAVLALGGLMHSKRQENEWSAMQDNEIWNITNEPNKIMKVLKLSYDNLSPELKPCFSFCAIFPKGYWIKKELLIQLWMAQGLLGASNERAGEDYFNILYLKSFFRDARRDEFGNVILVSMHDLVHNLAQSIAKFDCQVVVNEMQEDLSTCRHAALISPAMIKALYKAKKLRTIFSCKIVESPPHHGHVSSLLFINLRFLRVLDLSGSMHIEFPSSGSILKHLRYLDLSDTNIHSLPKYVTRLYHLQTLKLDPCPHLDKLPKELTNLINLRHLHIDPFQEWKKMPQMGKLRFLRTLPIFKVFEKDAGCGIAELECLNHLRGSLRICSLGHVKEVNSAKRANLIEKQHICELILDWGNSDRNNHDDNDDDVSVLEELQPPLNLRKLSIQNFSGLRFPSWVTHDSKLPNLVSFNISGCNFCEHIPSFGELFCLQVLEITFMSSVKRIGGSWDGSSTSGGVTKERVVRPPHVPYSSLKQLNLKWMENLEEWLEDVDTLNLFCPRLELMCIENCPKLRKTPHLFPSLKRLNLDAVGGMGVHSITSSLTSLTSLTISKSEDLMFLTQGLLQKNNHLEHLTISSCPKFQVFHPPNDNEGFVSSTADQEREQEHNSSSLKILEISDCPSITSMDLRGLISLHELTITRCSGLKSSLQGLQLLTALEKLTIGPFSEELLYFPFAAKEEENNVFSLHLLPSLRELQIYGWSCLKCLPDQLQHITTLKLLRIREFDGLTVLPEWLGKLASLEGLYIQDCENLMHLPSKEQMQRLTLLKELEIINCPLEEICDHERGGAEWHKISHIPRRIN